MAARGLYCRIITRMSVYGCTLRHARMRTSRLQLIRALIPAGHSLTRARALRLRHGSFVELQAASCRCNRPEHLPSQLQHRGWPWPASTHGGHVPCWQFWMLQACMHHHQQQRVVGGRKGMAAYVATPRVCYLLAWTLGFLVTRPSMGYSYRGCSMQVPGRQVRRARGQHHVCG